MTAVFTNIYLLIGVLHLAAVLLENQTLSYVSKPLLMPALIVWYLLATRSQRSSIHYIMVAAFVFSWAGDIFLMFTTELYFLAGLVSFLITHILYITVFSKEIEQAGKGMVVGRKPWLAAPVVIVAAGLIALVYNHVDAEMRIPIVIYAAVITVMVIMAINRHQNVSEMSFQSLLLGAILFMISDSLIALNKFYFDGELWQARFFIMLLYIAGQYLIAKGSTQALKT